MWLCVRHVESRKLQDQRPYEGAPAGMEAVAVPAKWLQMLWAGSIELQLGDGSSSFSFFFLFFLAFCEVASVSVIGRNTAWTEPPGDSAQNSER